MDLFGRACSGGFAEGCNNQGALYEHGRGVPENLGDAQRLYTQACRHGSGLGCSNLGVLYAQGRGVPMNREAAAQLFREACSLGSSVGCNNVVDSNPVPVETIEQTP
jgi:TPR repeat protein